jgi:hypothetical protein
MQGNKFYNPNYNSLNKLLKDSNIRNIDIGNSHKLFIAKNNSVNKSSESLN